MVRDGVTGPIMLGRDHHDPGGTDSPFRETANIKDGSNVCADMATHCFAGNAARGMSMVALHNGGGTGIGKAINGGFGLVLDGSRRVDDTIRSAMLWDVMGGVARRNWGRNPNAMAVSAEYNRENPNGDQITIPYLADQTQVNQAVAELFAKSEIRHVSERGTMRKLVECVPNFSEGRNSETIQAIAQAIRDTAGCNLLDVDPGASTNRTVVTFVGDPDAIVEGALAAARVARERIDMRAHKGEHPRVRCYGRVSVYSGQGRQHGRVCRYRPDIRSAGR